MSNLLVAYFSVSGVTKKVAEELANVENADMYEIEPKVPYSAADLDWKDTQSRSTLEMKDLNCRPEMADKAVDMAQYETVFIGFPIWWGREPSVVDTFLDAHDFSGKKIVPFCTSGGSGIDDAVKRIQELTGGKAEVVKGSRLGGDVSEDDLKVWAEGLHI